MLGRVQDEDEMEETKMRCGWEKSVKKRSVYVCVDGLSVEVVNKGFRWC